MVSFDDRYPKNSMLTLPLKVRNVSYVHVLLPSSTGKPTALLALNAQTSASHVRA